MDFSLIGQKKSRNARPETSVPSSFRQVEALDDRNEADAAGPDDGVRRTTLPVREPRALGLNSKSR